MKTINNEAVELLRHRFEMSKSPFAGATDVDNISEQAEANEYLVGAKHGIDRGLRMAIEILEGAGFKEVGPVVEANVIGLVGKFGRKP